jgi:hypothetical protein
MRRKQHIIEFMREPLITALYLQPEGKRI